MRAHAAAALLALAPAIALLPSAQAQKAAPSHSTTARASHGPQACGCENFGTLQQELAIALALLDKHQAKATELRQKYGDDPKGDKLAEARNNYRQFEAPPASGARPAPGSARDGLPPATGSVAQIAYVPRGQKLFEAHASDERNSPDNLKGIPDAVKYTADGRPNPDQGLRKQIEDKFRNAKKDLCDFADEAAVQAAMSSGSACAGLTQSLATHEQVHQQSCRAMGYYAFAERKPAQLADDEVRAYGAQVNALATEMRRVLGRKNVIIESGTATAEPRSLLSIKVRCLLAFTVNGQIDDLKLFGDVCDASRPYEIKTSPNANMKLTPDNDKAGAYAYSGNAGGATFYGSGRYTVELDKGSGTLTLDGSGKWNVKHPLGVSNKGGPERLRLKQLPEGCS